MIQTVRTHITGIVQGVGYRAFVERMASRLCLSGWVRNRRDGSVEALFSGESTAVAAMISACRSGPRMAIVDDIAVEEIAAAGDLRGFLVLATE
jgi:acylphosphatase